MFSKDPRGFRVEEKWEEERWEVGKAERSPCLSLVPLPPPVGTMGPLSISLCLLLGLGVPEASSLLGSYLPFSVKDFRSGQWGQPHAGLSLPPAVASACWAPDQGEVVERSTLASALRQVGPRSSLAIIHLVSMCLGEALCPLGPAFTHNLQAESASEESLGIWIQTDRRTWSPVLHCCHLWLCVLEEATSRPLSSSVK